MSPPARIGTDVGQYARKSGIDMNDGRAALLCFLTQRKPTGCFGHGEPSIKMQSALARSCCAVCSARPRVPDRAPCALCHILAWLDMQTIPGRE